MRVPNFILGVNSDISCDFVLHFIGILMNNVDDYQGLAI